MTKILCYKKTSRLVRKEIMRGRVKTEIANDVCDSETDHKMMDIFWKKIVRGKRFEILQSNNKRKNSKVNY